MQLDVTYWGGQRRKRRCGSGAPDKILFVSAAGFYFERGQMKIPMSRAGAFRSEEIV